jgi:hypothetical protein
MRGSKILDVKEIDALAEDLCLVILLDAEPLARITPPEARLKQVLNWVARHDLAATQQPRTAYTPESTDLVVALKAV